MNNKDAELFISYDYLINDMQFIGFKTKLFSKMTVKLTFINSVIDMLKDYIAYTNLGKSHNIFSLRNTSVITLIVLSKFVFKAIYSNKKNS